MSAEAISIWKDHILTTPDGLWREDVVLQIISAMRSRSPVSVLFCRDLERLEEYIYLITVAEEYLSAYPDHGEAARLLEKVLHDERIFSEASVLSSNPEASIVAAKISGLLSPVLIRLRESYGSYLLEGKCQGGHPPNALEVLRGKGYAGKVKCNQCGKIMLPSQVG